MVDRNKNAVEHATGLQATLDAQRRLHRLTNKIHSATNVDEIMLELAQDVCELLGADRVTIYALSGDRLCIVSKVKTGLVFKDLKLPINGDSIAAFVAKNLVLANIPDVYNENALCALSPQLRFLPEVDARSGYRSKQMLVSAVVDAKTRESLGVVQAINTKDGRPFPKTVEESLTKVCETLAIAFTNRASDSNTIHGRYDALIARELLTKDELQLAVRNARREGANVEVVLADEFKVRLSDIGAALGSVPDLVEG